MEKDLKFIDTNIIHKRKTVEGRIQIYEYNNYKYPLPTEIEISNSGTCNRKCVFCPKVDPNVAPDTYQKMTRKIINEIHDQLLEIHFNGTISLCGYGEPLLHKDINYIVKIMRFQLQENFIYTISLFLYVYFFFN